MVQSVLVAQSKDHSCKVSRCSHNYGCADGRVPTPSKLHMHTLPRKKTWGLLSAVVSGGKVRYELTFRFVGRAPQIGWVTTSFARADGHSDEGVGDNAHS